MSKNSLLVIRIRGTINVSQREKDTLKMLRVERNNYATLVDDRPDYKGMLQKGKDWITWGEPTVETVKTMLEKRGRILGNKKLTEEHVKEMGYKDFEDLAEKLVKCEVSINQIEGLKPFFRLHPPKKGFKKSVKKDYRNKGELGYRGEAINELVIRMC
ncbi:50S ribosomal protein L30 [Candidatus Bathyarchaeota archaeon]|nr:50S ribosomal protein L30 [Candidatus Bathyarchaeota archaeon]